MADEGIKPNPQHSSAPLRPAPSNENMPPERDLAQRDLDIPEINTNNFCFIIIKLHELDAEDTGIPADASNPTDDHFLSVLTDDAYGSIRQELLNFIDGLADDEKHLLLAVAMVGRGDFEAVELDQALQVARELSQPIPTYIVDRPLFAEDLEAGLSVFGYSCEDFEMGHL